MTTGEQDILIVRMHENLRILRLKLKLTQEEFGNLVGMSRFTIVSFENGKRKMPWSMFLSFVLIFIKNPATDEMLTLFKIYTDELNKTLKLQK